MTGRLILVSHAETDAIRRASFPDGEGLNQAGRKAARDQWMALPKRQFAFASPSPAARETAQLAGVETVPDAALGELDVGAWRGRALDEVAANDPAGFAAWIGEAEFRGHGGESIAGLIARTAGWLDGHLRTSGTIIAVSHAAFLRGAMAAVLQAPASAFWRIDVRPLSMMTFSSDGRRWSLREARY